MSSGKSEKLKVDGLLLSEKYISSVKTLYTKDLCNITFKIHQIPYVISETSSHFS